MDELLSMRYATTEYVQARIAEAMHYASGGTSPVLITKNITSNGVYDASDDNADGFSSVDVNVASGGVLIADITTDADANIIQINFDSEMNEYMYYIAKTECEVSGGVMYPCPQIDSTNLNAYGDSFSGAGVHTWNFIIAKSINNGFNHDMTAILCSGGSYPVPKIQGTTISYIAIKSYYDYVVFKAGAKLKLYGYVPYSEVI